jgi:hypothetical protein
LSPIPLWEECYSDDESEDKGDYSLPEELELPQTWMSLLNWRLLILEREENGVKHD